MENYVLDKTPFNSIRLFVSFNSEEGMKHFLNSKDYTLYELLSIWGGADKRESNMISWEFSISLLPYLKEKMSILENLNNVSMHVG